jgi:hypothetical protein
MGWRGRRSMAMMSMRKRKRRRRHTSAQMAGPVLVTRSYQLQLPLP